jgi:hypothetical protein
MARLRAVRTRHGLYSAEDRAWNRNTLSLYRHGQVVVAAVRYQDYLPPHLVERLHSMPPELTVLPASPTGVTRAEDRAILRAEAEALAPWKQAIAEARAIHRGSRCGTSVPAEPHAPEQHATAAEPTAPAARTQPDPVLEPALPRQGPLAPEQASALLQAAPAVGPALALAKPLASEPAPAPLHAPPPLDRHLLWQNPLHQNNSRLPEWKPPKRTHRQPHSHTSGATAWLNWHLGQNPLHRDALHRNTTSPSSHNAMQQRPHRPRDQGRMLSPPTLREQLLSATHHGTFALLVRRAGGWGVLATVATEMGLLPAAPLRQPDRLTVKETSPPG